jgi:hypothetical protein
MKTTILTCAAALFLVSANLSAQQMIVNMHTGLDQNLAPLALGQADDTWEIKKPGGNYGPVYVTTGRDAAYHSYNETFQDIAPGWGKNVLAPFLASGNDISQYPPANPTGKYIYRMQFQYNGCNTVTSAQIHFDVLSGAGISRLLVNGTVKTLPAYPAPISPYTNTDFYRLNDAWRHRPGISGPNGTLPIPVQTVPLNTWDIHNGTNTIFIEVDPSTYINEIGQYTAALMVLGYVEINYTPTAPIAQHINLSGSPAMLCNGTSGALNINLSTLPNYNTYNLGVSTGYFAQAAATQQIPINPTTTTNYAITLTSPAGCVTTVYHQVVKSVVPTLNAPSYVCAGSGASFSVNGISPTNNFVKIVNLNSKPLTVYQGVLNGSVIIYPTGTTNYMIYVTDAYGCITAIPWTVTVLPQPCFLLGRSASSEMDGPAETLSNQVIVSPNPNNGVFKITSPGAGTVDVISTLGTTWKTFEITGNPNGDAVDLTGVSKGVYVLIIQVDGKKITKRIVIE